MTNNPNENTTSKKLSSESQNATIVLASAFAVGLGTICLFAWTAGYESPEVLDARAKAYNQNALVYEDSKKPADIGLNLVFKKLRSIVKHAKKQYRAQQFFK